MSIDLGKISGIILSGGVGGIVALCAIAVMKPASTVMAQRPVKPEVEIPKATAHISGPERTLRVARSNDLSFHLIAKINEQPVRMLVDTGANITVLTRADAALIGMPAGDTGRHVNVAGINRTISRYRVVGEWPIGLGPIGLASVPIAIDDTGELQNSILGQDAFCNIDKIVIEKNEIAFIHNAPIAQGCPDRVA